MRWFVYDATNKLVLCGHHSEATAKEHAHAHSKDLPKGTVLAVLPATHRLIKEYARTHPAWREREKIPA